jgi:hypothetical protein
MRAWCVRAYGTSPGCSWSESITAPLMTCSAPPSRCSRPGCARSWPAGVQPGTPTGRLGPGPSWCWLTARGMERAGLPYPAAPPKLARLAHVRAVLAVRLWLADSEAYRAGGAWWESERRLRSGIRKVPAPHVADAEIHWPSVDGSPYAGQVWAVEVELTPGPCSAPRSCRSAMRSGSSAACTRWCWARPAKCSGARPRHVKTRRTASNG